VACGACGEERRRRRRRSSSLLTRTHTHTRAHIRAHTRTHTQTYTHTHAHARTHTRARAHTQTNIYAHIRAHTHTHAHAHVRARIHTHKHAHTRAHMHTHSLSLFAPFIEPSTHLNDVAQGAPRVDACIFLRVAVSKGGVFHEGERVGEWRDRYQMGLLRILGFMLLLCGEMERGRSREGGRETGIERGTAGWERERDRGRGGSRAESPAITWQ